MKRIALVAFVASLLLAGCGGSVGVPSNLTVSPPSASVLPSGQVQFTAVDGDGVDWSAPDGGTVVNGLFTAPPGTGSYRVIASDFFNPTLQAVANVTVANVAVSVSPQFVSVAKGSVNTNAFTAFVTGSANTVATWSVDQPAAGSISSGSNDGSGNARGTFTAGTTPGIFTVRATSSADSSVSGVAQVQVLGDLAVGLSPSAVTLSATPPNNSVVLTAVVTDSAGNVDTTSSLTWDVPLNTVGGSLTGSGLRQRTFTVPTSFLGTGICQVRVRTALGFGALATIQVAAN